KNFRRIKRRNVIPEKIMRILKRGPGGVNDERTQPEKDKKRMTPPDVGPHGLAERTSRQFSSSVRHCVLIMARSRAFKQMAIPLSRSRRREIGGAAAKPLKELHRGLRLCAGGHRNF